MTHLGISDTGKFVHQLKLEVLVTVISKIIAHGDEESGSLIIRDICSIIEYATNDMTHIYNVLGVDKMSIRHRNFTALPLCSINRET